jgi:thiamine pyrophosphokinase
MHALILADGAFPVSPNCLELLQSAPDVVCCDGAVTKLLGIGREPMAIVGDMDSIDQALKERFKDRLYPSPDQETNDLTKAVHFCVEKGYDTITILGATGLREDHTLGNIALLAEYTPLFRSVCLLTDYGRIDAVRFDTPMDDWATSEVDPYAPLISSTRGGQCTVARFNSFKGQQVSLFSMAPEAHLTSMALKYPLEHRCLTSWWQGTLNESLGDQFALSIDAGAVLVYRLNG